MQLQSADGVTAIPTTVTAATVVAGAEAALGVKLRHSQHHGDAVFEVVEGTPADYLRQDFIVQRARLQLVTYVPAPPPAAARAQAAAVPSVITIFHDYENCPIPTNKRVRIK